MNRLFKASVAENRKLIKDHYLLTLSPSDKIKKPKPGTFFMLSTDEGLDPLLKRPLSLHRYDGKHIHFLYRLVGKGTDILSRKQPGETLNLIGPLGNGFKTNNSGKRDILVAGGIGIAPVFALAETISRKNPLLFYGARTKKELLCLDEIQSLGIETVVSTDDGTFGKKGNAVHVMKRHMSRNPSLFALSSVYACGPEPMLKALASLVIKHELKGQLALEARMACGIGTCLGCVVNTTRGYKRVCKEGPVFSAEEIVWETNT